MTEERFNHRTPPEYNPDRHNCRREAPYGQTEQNQSMNNGPYGHYQRQDRFNGPQGQWSSYSQWQPPQWHQPVNALGVSGFIVSVIGLVIIWIPLIGVLVSLVGLGLSIGGLFRRPRGLAIAGVIISGVVAPVVITIIMLFFQYLFTLGNIYFTN